MDSAWSFDVLGFRVNVQATFLILVGIYVLYGLEAGAPLFVLASFAAVVFVSIVWHELGHATVARYLKVPVGEIHLHGLGGHVTTARTDSRRQLMISLAGPFAGLALGGIAIAVATAMGQ
ncbi:MAG: site-2 protease family protein, partial [Myxococcota bacterium]